MTSKKLFEDDFKRNEDNIKKNEDGLKQIYTVYTVVFIDFIRRKKQEVTLEP